MDNATAKLIADAREMIGGMTGPRTGIVRRLIDAVEKAQRPTATEWTDAAERAAFDGLIDAIANAYETTDDRDMIEAEVAIAALRLRDVARLHGQPRRELSTAYLGTDDLDVSLRMDPNARSHAEPDTCAPASGPPVETDC